jgi:hypothetical protein
MRRAPVWHFCCSLFLIGEAAYNICEKTVGYARHFDKLKTIDDNPSDGNPASISVSA